MVQWNENLPDDWEEIPDDPPHADRNIRQEELPNGQVVRDVEAPQSFIYADDDILIQDPDAQQE